MIGIASTIEIDATTFLLHEIADGLETMDQPDQAEFMESESTAMEQEPIFVSLSSDVQELLADNRIDLVDELRNLGVEVAKGDVAAPHTDEGGSAKEVTLVILASAAAFSAVCIGVAKIIDALGRNKKVIVTERECVPMRDESGAILLDKNGLPRMSWVKKSRMLEAMQTKQDNSHLEASFNIAKGLSLKLSSGDNEWQT